MIQRLVAFKLIKPSNAISLVVSIITIFTVFVRFLKKRKLITRVLVSSLKKLNLQRYNLYYYVKKQTLMHPEAAKLTTLHIDHQ